MSRPAHTTPLLLAVAGGALLHLSQPPADLGPLALVAFLPWFAALRSLAATDAGPAVAFRVGYAAGLVVFLAGFEFLRTLSGVDASNLALHGLWLLVGALLALYAGTYSSVAYLVLRRPVREWLFLMPLAWTLLELPRYGMPASAPVFFPGYSLHRFPALVQSADLGGVHAVSFFVVAVNAALFAALVSWRRTTPIPAGWRGASAAPWWWEPRRRARADVSTTAPGPSAPTARCWRVTTRSSSHSLETADSPDRHARVGPVRPIAPVGPISPCAVPPATDLAQGLGWASLVLCGAFLVGEPMALTWVAFLYGAGFIWLINGVHGGLRDLANDLKPFASPSEIVHEVTTRSCS